MKARASRPSASAAKAPGSAVLPASEFRRLDHNAAELGIPVSILMERAGTALADAVQAKLGTDKEVVVFCGKGHNGGDGLCAAVLLGKRGIHAHVVLAEPPGNLAPDAAVWFDRLKAKRWTVWDGEAEPAWNKATVLVDALLGTGLSAAPRSPYNAIIRHLNQRRTSATVIACDVPSGLGTRLAVQPHATVTFHAKKTGMTKANSGAVHVVDIGIPAAASHVGFGDLLAGYTIPRHDSHKGDNGIVGIVAGSIPYTGAPFYAAWAALRTGADLAHIFTPQACADVLRTYGPEPIVHATNAGPHLTPDGIAAIKPHLKRLGCLIVGPGLGKHRDTKDAVAQLLELAAKAGIPLVIDADGLDAVTPAFLRKHGRHIVLTPHAKEFQDLSGHAATDDAVVAYARQHKVTVLCKRAGALIADEAQHRFSHRGHPTMTVGGTGDVLAGTVAELIAKGANPFDGACAAAYLVGCAGELAASQVNWGASAFDLAEAIPAVLGRLEADE